MTTSALDHINQQDRDIGKIEMQNLAEPFFKGRQYGEQSALNQIKIQEGNLGLADLEATNNLRTLASQGDRAAMTALARKDPEYGEKLQKYENETTYALGREATAAIQNTPIEFRNKAYDSIYRKAEAMGKDVSYFPLPGGPWSDKKQEALEFASKQAASLTQEIQRQQLALRNREINIAERGGATGIIAERASYDDTFRKGLYASKGGANKGFTVNPQGDIAPFSGLPESEETVENSNETGKLRAQLEYKPAIERDIEVEKNRPGIDKGQKRLTTIIGNLEKSYDKLEKSGAITSTKRSMLSNVGTSIASSEKGQYLGRKVGSANQALRDDINVQRPALISAIIGATGMSAKQLDSNAELQFQLQQATDPSLGIQVNRQALKYLKDNYLNASAKQDYTEDDINHTAQLYGISPAEVRRRLNK